MLESTACPDHGLTAHTRANALTQAPGKSLSRSPAATVQGRTHPRRHRPVYPLGLLPTQKHQQEIMFCSDLVNSAVLAKAREGAPYLQGLKRYTSGNKQIKQKRAE